MAANPSKGRGLNGDLNYGELATLVAPPGKVVQKEHHVRAEQRVRNNTYIGDWHFGDEESRARGHLGCLR